MTVTQTEDAPEAEIKEAIPRTSKRETRRVSELLRTETVGGLVLIGAAVIAVIWANSPLSGSYIALRDAKIGPAALGLNLSVGTWAADGLLAVFFFLVGLELKHEFVAGDLRKISKAIVPVAAAVGGVVVPALIYLSLNAGGPGEGGWAIPAATDIAFALAILAVISSHLPSALRSFLLTLAVVDDLIAILIIALVYTEEIHLLPLALSVIPFGLFGFLVQKYPNWFANRLWSLYVILLPIGFVAWVLVHDAGIHATIAGVVLGLLVPVLPNRKHHKNNTLDRKFEYYIRPISSGFAVPMFALFSAGVVIGGPSQFAAALRDPVTLGVIFGLVMGKPIGIVLTSFIVTQFTRARLDRSIGWPDIFGVGVLAGIGFTVSLLVAELSFPPDEPMHDHGKLGVLLASVIAAVLAAIVLGARNRHYQQIEELEAAEEAAKARKAEREKKAEEADGDDKASSGKASGDDKADGGKADGKASTAKSDDAAKASETKATASATKTRASKRTPRTRRTRKTPPAKS